MQINKVLGKKIVSHWYILNSRVMIIRDMTLNDNLDKWNLKANRSLQDLFMVE